MRFLIIVKATRNSAAGVIEVRQLFELDDFEQTPAVGSFATCSGLPSKEKPRTRRAHEHADPEGASFVVHCGTQAMIRPDVPKLEVAYEQR